MCRIFTLFYLRRDPATWTLVQFYFRERNAECLTNKCWNRNKAAICITSSSLRLPFDPVPGVISARSVTDTLAAAGQNAPLNRPIAAQSLGEHEVSGQLSWSGDCERCQSGCRSVSAEWTSSVRWRQIRHRLCRDPARPGSRVPTPAILLAFYQLSFKRSHEYKRLLITPHK